VASYWQPPNTLKSLGAEQNMVYWARFEPVARPCQGSALALRSPRDRQLIGNVALC
jgi:hypothetical protein